MKTGCTDGCRQIPGERPLYGRLDLTSVRFGPLISGPLKNPQIRPLPTEGHIGTTPV